MAPTVQKDANGNTVCRRDSQGRKIACAKCIKGHRTSMCKPSHTEGVQTIDGVGRKQGSRNRSKNGRLTANDAAGLVQQAMEQARSSDDENSMASLQSHAEMQAASSSQGSTSQSTQELQFPPQFQPHPSRYAPVPAVDPFQEMQANQPAFNAGAVLWEPQQRYVAQQLAEPGTWHDPMYQMQGYQPLGYVEPGFAQPMQMQEPQPLADIQGPGLVVLGQTVTQPLPPNLGATTASRTLHDDMAPSQHPVQVPEVDYLADHDQFNELFPLSQEDLDRGINLLLDLQQERSLR
ncbi:hypothetical protein NW768_008059 [Fusarium equiseti]|uniref:Copper-fist domain-containing protein n=1 Tax=Fusarium equiseti TaxID=61235 RepID=A0ABQ8R5N9_FUSEQ|nr:hypothetical protein NW768_008059 [Fusarium equiseti]